MISSAPFHVLFFGECTLGLHQIAHRQNKLIPIVSGDSKDTCIHANGVLRTRLNAVTAINTFEQIDFKLDRHFFRSVVQPFACLDGNAFGRTVGLAHETGDAFHRPVFVPGQPVASTPSRCDLRLQFRVVADIQFGGVQKISDKMAESRRHTLEDLDQVHLLGE